MRALLAQVSPIVGAVRANLGLVLDALARGRTAHADLVVLPELVLSGYPPRDLLDYGGFVAACEAAAAEAVVATEGEGPVLVFGAPTRDAEGLRNSAIVAQGGRIVAVRHKALLPNYDVFDETRYFVPETHVRPVRVAGVRLGITLCEDIWNAPDLFPRHRYTLDPVADLVGCDVLLNLSASPFHAGKGMLRRALVRGKAVRARAPLLFVNQVGGNDELVFDGHSLAVDAYGGLLGEAASFAPDHVLVDTRAVGAGEPRDLPFEEEVVEALTLGIRDYAVRCGFHSAVLGLSGGVDSAVVCTLAARALGASNVLAVAMPGPYSSPISLEDARVLAGRLGTGFLVLPIQEAYDALRATLAERFAGRPFDVAEENLQARVRGALVMALSNKEGHLVLTTGNKSEAAVGYCTLYGDMAGGLAVLSDVFKTDVYRLARWLNRDEETIPSRILDRPPSAELAPDQQDERSLMPYVVLDAILRLYLEDEVDPADIVARGHDAALVHRVVRLVAKSEYKRWQAAPGLRVTPRAFGTGRRIPLAHQWRWGG
ncbi:MAG: NAD+ synthase [Deltaproteobacteria bacterium]|nr:NAD+ synthase [Deltaproteobacteria bacterium]